MYPEDFISGGPAGPLEAITTFMLDIDGVLTDGFVYCPESGGVLRGVHSKDGFALQYARRMGYNVCVISGGDAEPVAVRLRNLGVTDIYLRTPYKLDVYARYLEERNLSPEETLYVGDDMPDFEVMRRAGIAVAPADAADDILQIADYVTRKPGGRGCVREVVEKVMKHQGKWYDKECFVW